MRGFCIKFLAVSIATFAVSGCIPSTHPPERLYTIPYEMDLIRSAQDNLASQYSATFLSSPSQAKLIRNEIIAQRMYAIDVQYTRYENSLTREGQEVGFGALTAAEGLSTAATLVVPAATKTILSAAATGVLAVKGHYDSEVLLAQTMRTIQKQMRASRSLVAANISAKLVQSVTDYPLSSALSDLEEYYSAGTVTSGVIDTSTTVGIKEADNKIIKQVVTQAPPTERAAVLRAATPAGPVQVITRPAIIRDVNVPIARFVVRSSSSPTRLSKFEQKMSLKDMKAELVTLCVAGAESDLGPAGSPARKALAGFLSANGKPASENITENVSFDIQDLRMAGKRNC